MNDSLQITLGQVGFGLSNGSQVEKAFSNYCADLLLKLEGTVKIHAQISDRRPEVRGERAQGIGGEGRRGFSKNNGLRLALIEVEEVCTHPCFVSQTVKQCSLPINPEGEIQLDIICIAVEGDVFNQDFP